LNKKFEIIFTKKNILIEMLKNGDDLKSIYDYKYDNSEIRFKKKLTFKNMDLIKEIILKNNRSMGDFNFYLVDLIDSKEVNNLVQNLFKNYEKNTKNEIIIPNVVSDFFFKRFIHFKNLYDINFIYQKKF
jgi:hypothetical protein